PMLTLLQSLILHQAWADATLLTAVQAHPTRSPTPSMTSRRLKPFNEEDLRGLLDQQRRPTDLLPFEMNVYLDVVGDLDKRDAFVHSVVFSVEDHLSLDIAHIGSPFRNCQF